MTRDEAPGAQLTGERAADVKLVAKGGATQILGQVVQKGLTFVFVALIVRFLGTAEYGIYRQVFQVLTVAMTLAAGGFPVAAVRFIARARAAGDPSAARGAARVALTAAAISGMVIFAAGVLAADRLAAAFADSGSGVEYLAFLFRVGAAYVPLYACMQVMRLCTQAYKTMTPSVVVGNIIQPIARFGLSAIALLAGFAVTGVIVALVLSAGIGLLAGLWYYARLLTDEDRAAPPKWEVGPMLRFAFPQAGAIFFSTQSLGLGVILVGLFGLDREVGIYGIAQSLQLAGGLFLSSIVGIWGPMVVDIYEQGDLGRLQSLYQTINRWVATLSIPIFAALILQPELFVTLIAGQKGAGAVVLVPILAVGNIFFVGTGPSGYLLSMTGRPVLNLVNSIVSVALYVGLGILVVPTYGAIGMAIVDSTVTILINVAKAIEGKIFVGVQPFGRTFLKPVAATLAASGILLIWRVVLGHSTVTALVGLALAGLVYVGILRVLGLDPQEELVIGTVKQRVTGMLRRSKR
ncbi:MAG: flippase [Actinobacteria bacterium]|nr:flippase [Actinomycetota bacterium]